MKHSLLDIDGAIGEGGGQILRTALSLSILTQTPIRIFNIRANRNKPGLRPQHISAIQLSAQICNARTTGVSIGSSEISFYPNNIKPGNFKIDVGTAGSAILVLQTVFLPLTQESKKSKIRIQGGTHVPWSPCYEYLEMQWYSFLSRMGLSAKFELINAGFYPKGGGLIVSTIQTSQTILPLELTDRGQLVKIRGISAVGNLNSEIAKRQKLQALKYLELICKDTKIKAITVPSAGQGTYLFLKANFQTGSICSTALGAPGKRAEIVAEEAVENLSNGLNSGAAVDEYLADQLLLPAAFATGITNISTSKITTHLLTNAKIIQLFGQATVIIKGELGQPGSLSIYPM